MTSRRRVTRWRKNSTAPDETAGQGWTSTEQPDVLAVEEPLEIRLDGQPFTVTMRTPGHDLDLALGFLVSESVIAAPEHVVTARHCPDAALDADGRPTYNVVEVVLGPGATPPDRDNRDGSAPRAPRQVNSACGVCGTTSIDEIHQRSRYDLRTDQGTITPDIITALPDKLREQQKTFDRTGGLHAAGLFTASGDLLCLREDVGRHNAVDKVVGWALQQERLPVRGSVLQVSGRASFELVQKAAGAGIAVLAAVSAPSSLAVELADNLGMTLIGFSRPGTFTAYTGVQRVTP